jgi:hypothetical protein
MTATIAAVENEQYSRVDLTVTDDTYKLASIQRSVDNGLTWDYVRGNATWNTITLYGTAAPYSAHVPDAEAPFDVPLLYRAQGTDGLGNFDAWTQTVAVQLDAPPGGDWVIAPLTNPGYRMAMWTREQPSYDRADPVGVFYALGRSDPIVTAGVRRAPTGALALYVPDAAVRTRIEQMLDTYVTFVVRSPIEHGWGVRICVFGDVTFDRFVNRGVECWDVHLPWWSIVGPQVAIESYTITYYDVRTHFATYGTVRDNFASYAALREAVL